MKMVKNYDIDGTGLVNYDSLMKVFTLLGVHTDIKVWYFDLNNSHRTLSNTGVES